MRRPWHTWTLFFLFLGVVITAMAWVTVIVARLQAENIKVQKDAALEETVRLALWRMDAAISPLIIEESSRPHTDYNAVNPMAQLFPNVAEDNAGDLVPSPLFVRPASNVVLYFNGRVLPENKSVKVTSPQIPPTVLEEWGNKNFDVDDQILGRNRTNLAAFQANVDINELQQTIILADQVGNEGQAYAVSTTNSAAFAMAANQPLPLPQPGDAQTDELEQTAQVGAQVIQANPPGQQAEAQQVATRQQALNDLEYQRRFDNTAQAQKKVQWSKKVRQETTYNPANYWRKPVKGKADWKGGKGKPAPPVVLPPPRRRAEMFANGPSEGVMRPIWVNDMLLLSRNVTIDGAQYVQGAWLDWEAIRAGLLDEIRDLLPEARLVPVASPGTGNPRRMLGSLPVMLVPGPMAMRSAVITPPLGTPLLVAWAGIIISVSAVTALLFGAMSLSERRGAFVSAVTHELRTPLTTFRMYTEMLSEGLIKDKEKRKSYLVTLNRESNRLGHLVENVLAYARLERGAGARVLDLLSSGEVIERARSALAARAQDAGMQLLIEYEADHADARLRTDPSAVGQILLNLVDNACKYARNSTDKRIHLSARKESRYVVFRVRDHGSGLKRGEIRMVFKPFRKSARDAARSAPGVGLGLALCSRLASQLGGSLSYESHPDGGACFILRLPAA